MANQRLPSLDRLKVFDAAARQRSFTRAAGELFLTQSAVSRQIAALEAELGLALFVRRHRALDLTDDGRRLAAAVAQALGVLETTVAQLREPHGREVLTITTTPGLASLWLIPRLASFTQAHPGVDVRIDASHDVRPMERDGYDLAIRYGRSGALAGTPLFDEVLVPMCAPALLKRTGAPLKSPADLRHHTLLQIGSASAGHGIPSEWASWLTAVNAAHLEPAALLTFNTYDTAIAAAVAGQGVVLGRRPITDRLLRSKALVAPFEGQWSMEHGYSLVMSAAARRRPAALALHDWLLQQARAKEAR
ncbi:MAG: LysR substrate-binding domain-containing protein [Aquincola tertiaricarbonis]